ncbi:restriction endonuclease subunit S [uncultured Varibaculum sp.]|uniref:restriction endonuclease subunit S n=1 Tax=uncultured Varibaculum sp. TaxID=413896 RepID=UPI0025848772|nr:restriction endonuclease subunit S [uncultured Varibaculum sp.]
MKTKDLKNSILQLAVKGKLVAQDPADEDASILVERIRKEKHRLISEGKTKFPKGGESIIYTGSDGLPYEKRVDKKGKVISETCIQDEVPFEIPNTWTWLRLPEITAVRIGKTPSRHNDRYWQQGTIPWFSISDMRDGCLVDRTKEKVTQQALDDCFKTGTVPAGTLLMSFKLTIGKTTITAVDGVHNEAIVSLISFLDVSDAIRNYLLYVLPLVVQNGETKSAIKGKTLNSKSLAKLLIPLPPLGEQQRIVERVRDLLPLVEEYGDLEDEREALDQVLPDRLRKSILQQAVSGKLVAQDPADEDASILVERIRKEKHRLISEGKTKFPKDGESIIYIGSDGCHYEKHIDKKGKVISETCIQAEIPFEIPNTWTWARLGTLCNFGSCKSIEYKKVPPGSWVLNLEDIESGTGRFTIKRKMNSKGSAKHCFSAGMVLYSKLRPYLNKVVVAKENGVSTPEIIPLDFRGHIIPRFAQLMLMSPGFVDYAKKCSYGVKMPRLGTKDGANALMAIPPLTEQQRIVERVQELLNLCCE